MCCNKILPGGVQQLAGLQLTDIGSLSLVHGRMSVKEYKCDHDVRIWYGKHPNPRIMSQFNTVMVLLLLSRFALPSHRLCEFSILRLEVAHTLEAQPYRVTAALTSCPRAEMEAHSALQDVPKISAARFARWTSVA